MCNVDCHFTLTLLYSCCVTVHIVCWSLLYCTTWYAHFIRLLWTLWLLWASPQAWWLGVGVAYVHQFISSKCMGYPGDISCEYLRQDTLFFRIERREWIRNFGSVQQVRVRWQCLYSGSCVRVIVNSFTMTLDAVRCDSLVVNVSCIWNVNAWTPCTYVHSNVLYYVDVIRVRHGNCFVIHICILWITYVYIYVHMYK